MSLLFDDPDGRADRLAGRDDLAPGRSFLLRAEGLRPGQPGHPRAQGRDQGRLQPAAQDRAAGDLGALAAAAVSSIRPCSACSRPGPSPADFIRQVAKIWLVVGVGGLLFRTVHLFFIRDVQTGLVWMTKILTDPFHDIKLYHKAPLYLLTRRADRSRPREARQARVRAAAHRSADVDRSSCPALVPGIEVLARKRIEDVDGRHRRADATRSFGRLCPAMTAGDGAASAPEPLARQHLFQDLPLDGLVGERRVVPPPAVAPASSRRRATKRSATASKSASV